MASLELLQASSGESREERRAAWHASRERMLRSENEEQLVVEAAPSTTTIVVRHEAVAGMGTTGGATRTTESAASTGGLMVSGAKQLRDQLEGKKRLHGSEKVRRMMPQGSFGLKLKVPKRKTFGVEGEEGDAAHAAAMAAFSIKEFGSTSVKASTIDVRMQRVGAFGWWLLVGAQPLRQVRRVVHHGGRAWQGALHGRGRADRRGARAVAGGDDGVYVNPGSNHRRVTRKRWRAHAQWRVND